ncbi:hypothetical protein RhiirC2_804356 [Rhizophagus irregularis]|uniref:Uncharacterized protein n=1 Tax=Rhizophagus irregularis TaxID=588596 RepID=A0A2N1L116_9GLOM|nr:hypothetical protein RhiirC2_804356 [Rhizophagus irregularis]
MRNIKQSKSIIPLLPEEKEIYNNAEHCWVCEKEFGRPEEKVRDHCHITGYNSHRTCLLIIKVTVEN